jgi:hypothetical protein
VKSECQLCIVYYGRRNKVKVELFRSFRVTGCLDFVYRPVSYKLENITFRKLELCVYLCIRGDYFCKSEPSSYPHTPPSPNLARGHHSSPATPSCDVLCLVLCFATISLYFWISYIKLVWRLATGWMTEGSEFRVSVVSRIFSSPRYSDHF